MRVRGITALPILFACMAAMAADTAQPTSARPDPAVGEEASGTVPGDSKATDKAPEPKPVPDTKSEPKVPGDFKPSEDISEDMAVAYPVDI
jgi:hypothetical protein